MLHVPRTSALSRELEPLTEYEHWANGDYDATILADLFDLAACGFAKLMAKGTGRTAKSVPPYPRPGSKPKTQHIGSDPIPASEFWDWWYSNGN